MPQIDIKIQSSADVSGFVKTETAAQALERMMKEVNAAVIGMQSAVAVSSRTAEQAINKTAAAAVGVQGAAVAAGRSTSQAMLSAGYQVQDLAIQLAGGQNALRAVAQQGSQFLGVFGPTGAIAGAVLAVGALALQFMGVGSSAKEADDQVKKLTESLDRIHEKSVTAFRRGLLPVDDLKSVNAELDATKAKLAEIEGRREKAMAGISQVTREIGDPNGITNNVKINQAGLRKYGITDVDVLGAKSFFDEMSSMAAKAEQEQVKVREKIVDLTARAQELERAIAKDADKDVDSRRKRLEQALGDEEKAFDAMLSRTREKNANTERDRKANEDLAKSYREFGDAGAKYARQLDEIQKLEKAGTLSAGDAAAARLKLKADFEDLAGKAIRKAREEVEQYDIALAKLDRNPGLSDSEKQKERVTILNDQAAAIKRVKQELTSFMAAHPGVDVGGLTSALQTFSDKGARNGALGQPAQTLAQRDSIGVRDLGDPGKHYQSAGAGMAGALFQEFGQIGTMGDQLARTFSAVGSSIRESMGNAFASMVTTGGSARSKIVAFGNAIGLSFIQNAAKMVADWIYQHAIMATVRRVFHITDVAETTAAEATKTTVTGVGTGARILMTMKETGANLIQAGIKAMTAVASVPYIGPFLAIAALGAVIAAGAKVMKGFATGGVVDGGKQPIWINENGTESVLNARATSMLGRAGVDALNAGQLIPQITAPGYQPAINPAGAAGGSSGDSGRGNMHVAFIDGRNPTALEDLERDPRFEGRIVHLMQKHRGKLGVRW